MWIRALVYPESVPNREPFERFTQPEPPCEGFFSTTGEIDIVNGSFRLLNEQGGIAGYWDISGRLDGNTASGEATVQAVGDQTCSGSWTASPAP